MKFFALVLQQNRNIVSKADWVLNPAAQYTKIFHSPNAEDEADFTYETKLYFNPEVKACYEARVMKQFCDIEDAQNFCDRTRTNFYDRGNKQFSFERSTTVETINMVSVFHALAKFIEYCLQIHMLTNCKFPMMKKPMTVQVTIQTSIQSVTPATPRISRR